MSYYRPGGFSFFPPVIKNLLIINGVIFFLMTMFQNVSFNGIPSENIIIRWFALMPLGSGYFELWQLITYQFLHGGFSHILFNMFALWMFGAEIELNWGSKKFLLYYLLCGVGAGLLHMFLAPLLTGSAAPTIGASGAVYGIMIAFAMMFPDRPVYLYFLLPIKAKYLITFLVLMEFMLIDSAGSGVAHLAHLGGAIVGFAFIMLDKDIYVPFKTMFRRQNFKRKSSNYFDDYDSGFFKSRSKSSYNNDIKDASFYDLEENDDEIITQEEIDRILDKISKHGYAGLSDKEKKILFEASKKIK